MIFQGRGRPQGNGGKTDLRLFPKKSRFFKVEAARRATGTKLTFVYLKKMTIFRGRGRPQGNRDKKDLRLFPKKYNFQGRGRPQGNGDKTDLRLFPKNHDCSRSGPPASVQNLTSRPNFETFSIPFWIILTRVFHWKPQKCPKILKLVQNPSQN